MMLNSTREHADELVQVLNASLGLSFGSTLALTLEQKLMNDYA
jgi:hypothetical protein